MPVLFVLAARHFAQPLVAVEAAAFCFLLVGLAAMDVETSRLPDAFTLPGLAVGLVQALLPGGGLIAASQVHFPFPAPQIPPAFSSLAGAAGASGLLLLIRWLYHLLRKKEGLGLGDVKLAGLLGAWLGLSGTLLALALGVLLAACAGLVLIAAKRPARQLPFGAFLVLGGLITLFLKVPLLHWYFSFWL